MSEIIRTLRPDYDNLFICFDFDSMYIGLKDKGLRPYNDNEFAIDSEQKQITVGKFYD